jgi:hypothetical protein
VSEKGAVVALEVFTSDEKMEKEKVGFDRDDEFCVLASWSVRECFDCRKKDFK